MAHFETMVSQKEVFAGRVIRVTVDEAMLENGKTSTREVVHHNGGACVAALTDDDQIYLVRQYRYALGQELWELPAGKLEAGEDPFEAAKRELGEECGLVAQHYTPLGEFYPTVGFCTEIIYSWVAQGLSQCPMQLDDDEFLTPEKVPLQTAVDMVLDGRIKDGKTVAGVLKIAALKAAGKL